MRTLLLLCLAIIQYSTMATSAAAQSQYDAVFSICTNMVPVGHGDLFVANMVAPSGAAAAYFKSRGIAIDHNEELKITLIKGPDHGELKTERYAKGIYGYLPNEGYLGPDQMSFSVEVKGKILKVIYSVYVDRNSEYIPPECGSSYNGFMIKELPNPTRVKGKGNK